jgi:hypothetical protein
MVGVGKTETARMTPRQLLEQWHADAKTLPQWGAEAEARKAERRRLHAEHMHATVPVADVPGTVLIDIQKAAA